MKKQVLRFKDMTILVFERRHVHQVLQFLLVLIDFIAVFVNFNNRTINDECAVIRVCLKGLFVISIAKLGFEVFV